MRKFKKEIKVLKSEIVYGERNGFETFKKELIEEKTFYEGELFHTMYRVVASNLDYKKWYDIQLYLTKIYRTKAWAIKYLNKINFWYQLDVIG